MKKYGKTCEENRIVAMSNIFIHHISTLCKLLRYLWPKIFEQFKILYFFLYMFDQLLFLIIWYLENRMHLFHTVIFFYKISKVYFFHWVWSFVNYQTHLTINAISRQKNIMENEFWKSFKMYTQIILKCKNACKMYALHA